MALGLWEGAQGRHKLVEHTALIEEIGTYCRRHNLSESTFGRRAVNDGKLVSRLRDGRSITLNTLEKVHEFIARDGELAHSDDGPERGETLGGPAGGALVAHGVPPAAVSGESVHNFRFFDNRQKYLLFVNTCSEKWEVAKRVGMELTNIQPQPPAVRVFDAGVGDGTVLARVMRSMHARFKTLPHYIVGKEVSLEDVRLALEKTPDRFFEHPATVLVLTNMFYSEAPWLRVNSPAAASTLLWHEVPLEGDSSHAFERQITDLQPFLDRNWKAKASPKTGNPVYERPVVLVLYREDHRFMLDSVIPRHGLATADFDLVIASQPYRLRVTPQFKAEKVIAPLARALRPGGRLIGIHSHGGDPGLEIIRRVWPDENPYTSNRHDVLKAVRQVLGSTRRDLNYNAYSDARSIFRFDMHALPNELSGPIGTSTLFAAWNAAIYVAQIEDARLSDVVRDGRYYNATADVLRDYGGLWFNDETYVISRKKA